MGNKVAINWAEVARKRNGTVVSEEEVALNDDLCHPVLIIGEDKKVVAGVLIKDLEGKEEHGTIIEATFFDKFIENAKEAFTQARLIMQEAEVEDGKKESPEY